jgi:hypothetical protein
MEIKELDQLQKEYKTAVDTWIASIRKEEALASTEHSVADLDAWEQAEFAQEDAADAAKEAKKRYEDGLREKFFNF